MPYPAHSLWLPFTSPPWTLCDYSSLANHSYLICSLTITISNTLSTHPTYTFTLSTLYQTNTPLLAYRDNPLPAHSEPTCLVNNWATNPHCPLIMTTLYQHIYPIIQPPTWSFLFTVTTLYQPTMSPHCVRLPFTPPTNVYSVWLPFTISPNSLTLTTLYHLTPFTLPTSLHPLPYSPWLVWVFCWLPLSWLHNKPAPQVMNNSWGHLARKPILLTKWINHTHPPTHNHHHHHHHYPSLPTSSIRMH